MSKQQLLVSVDSVKGVQPGQAERSSGDFSTEDAPSGTNGLLWIVSPNDPGVSPDGISFDVIKDRSGWTDETYWSGVKNNDQTSYQASRTLYIANNLGSGPSGFTVYVYAVIPD